MHSSGEKPTLLISLNASSDRWRADDWACFAATGPEHLVIFQSTMHPSVDLWTTAEAWTKLGFNNRTMMSYTAANVNQDG